MSITDPLQCRRALREIGEIAAVAVLQDSQRTEQEALQTIAAIADWADDDAAGDPAACGEVIHRQHAMTHGLDFDGPDDREATELFAAVRAALRPSSVGAEMGVPS